MAGDGACNKFTQTNMFAAPVAQSGFLVGNGGFRFTQDPNGQGLGVLDFIPDAASVGKTVTIFMAGLRPVDFVANETLQLQSALNMNVSDPGGLTIGYSALTNWSVGGGPGSDQPLGERHDR